jgi:hypothetical protein
MEFKSVGFESILFDKNEYPYTENERQIKTFDSNIKCFKDKFGSYRFIFYENDIAVSGLHMMVDSNNIAIAMNVITLNEYRRLGFAKRVHNEMKKHFNKIAYSSNLSDLGRIYVEKLGK